MGNGAAPRPASPPASDNIPHESNIPMAMDTSNVNRTDLDPILLPYLAQSPYVSSDVERIITECQRTFPHASRAALGQLIREWFRKRREYMTHRVYNYCNKHYRLMEGKEVLNMLRNNEQALDAIRDECRLDITEVTASRDFAFDRVESFFMRRKSR